MTDRSIAIAFHVSKTGVGEHVSLVVATLFVVFRDRSDEQNQIYNRNTSILKVMRGLRTCILLYKS